MEIRISIYVGEDIMKKLDKAKVNRLIDVLRAILALMCFATSIITQLHIQNTTQALCWIIVGILVIATRVEVK